MEEAHGFKKSIQNILTLNNQNLGEKMSIFKTLNKAAAETKKTKKSTSVELSNEKLEDSCLKIIKASKEEKNAIASKAQAGSEIIEFVSGIHGQSLRDNNLTRTFRLNSKVMITFADKFSALGEEDIEEATEILDEAGVPFDRLFREKANFTLKANVQENEKLLEELVTKLGDDFTKYFDIKTQVSPVKDFYNSVAKEGCYDQLKDLIERTRHKPTVKVS